MIFKWKFKAGSLPFVIILSLLLLSLCSMLVLFYVLNYKVFFKELSYRCNVDNIESALNIVLNSPEYDNQYGTYPIKIFDDAMDSSLVVSSRWGFYDIVTVQSGDKKFKQTRTALIGAQYDRIALFLSTSNDYLYLSGKTFIKGDCYVPGGVVKSGSFNGSQFAGDRLVDGQQFKSSSALLEIMYKEKIDFADSLVLLDTIKNFKKLTNSFKSKTLTLYSEQNILLSDCIISGNILIKSKGLIEIDSSCKLKDIILSAAYIKINDYTKAQFQAFASDSILVGKHCFLSFPSSLGVIGSNQKQKIAIQNHSIVHGTIVLNNLNSLNYNSRILISKDAQVNGLIYSNCKIEHQGIVHGSIYCKEFVISSGSSEFNNYIYNAEINAEALDLNFVYPLLFDNYQFKQVVEWLN